MLGDSLEVLEQCTDLPVACYHALRRAGKYDDAVEHYGACISSHAIVDGAYLQGSYEDVLAMGQVGPGHSVGALVELGRAEEAIERFPEHSAPAFLALGRYEELLERFPPISRNADSRTAALLALGRTREVDDLLTDPAGGWSFSPLLLHLHPDAMLEIRHPDAHRYASEARVLIVINALLAGNTPAAEETLEQIQGIRSADFWWYDHNGTELLVAAILRNMPGFPAGLHDDLEEIVANHKYKDKQALWHDAAYLSGKITATAYRAQPQQRRIEERVSFIRATANDLKGHHRAARKGYEDVLDAPRRSFESQAFMRQRFATWRLQEL
jgi:tetratricopeptide (TPR) repeat protein